MEKERLQQPVSEGRSKANVRRVRASNPYWAAARREVDNCKMPRGRENEIPDELRENRVQEQVLNVNRKKTA